MARPNPWPSALGQARPLAWRRPRLEPRSAQPRISGALLLCDYLLARPTLLRGATVLELGAGCGLTGLLAASVARRVFITDCVENVLSNAHANVPQRRRPSQPPATRLQPTATALTDTQVGLNGVDAVARVRTLDWAEPVLPLPDAGDDEPSNAAGPYSWSAEERSELGACSLILAADCVTPALMLPFAPALRLSACVALCVRPRQVYSNEMTDALVACLHTLLHSLPRGTVALVSMELRINFCLSSMAARAPAVDYFKQGLEVAGLEFGRVPSDSFPQRFTCYERVKELELWRVTAPCTGEANASETVPAET